MKRPMLVSGIALALCCTALVCAGAKALWLLLILTALVFILYLIKPLRLRNKIIIPTICISVILACLSYHCFYETKITPCLSYNGYEVPFSGKVVDVPIVSDKSVKFTVKTDTIGDTSIKTKITVTAPLQDNVNIEPFSYVAVHNPGLTVICNDSGKPEASHLSDGTVLEADATEIEALYQCDKTPFYYCLRLKQLFTQQINNYLNSDEAGFLLGMLFGGNNQLNSATLNAFRASGIAHLLAVSGLHTSLWCGFLLSLMKLLHIKEKLRNLICIVFLCGFCIISAFTPSVLRASLMMSLFLASPLFSRQQDSLNSLGFAVSILLLANPYVIASVSFQLSVLSTLGVLLSHSLTSKILEKNQKIKNNIFRRIINYIAENICISSFAGLFTLPLSAYYFGVVSIFAPVTNILCVKVAFWGMMSGFIATLLSFIPVYHIKTIAILIFKAASILLNIVITIAESISGFSLCTIPVHTESLTSGLAVILFFGLCIFILRNKLKPLHKKAISVICVLSLALCIFLPCTPLFGTRITVSNVGNGINLTLRSGLKYAFFNCGTSNNNLNIKALPRATSESLDFLYISSPGKSNGISERMFNYSPKTTVITSFVNGAYRETGIVPPQNTVVADTFTYRLNNRITVETVDTYTMNCVIIEWSNKNIIMSYGSYNNFTKIFNTYGTPDILILSEDIPQTLPARVDTIIISSDAEIIKNTNVNTLKSYCNTLLLTAESGDINI